MGLFSCLLFINYFSHTSQLESKLRENPFLNYTSLNIHRDSILRLSAKRFSKLI